MLSCKPMTSMRSIECGRNGAIFAAKGNRSKCSKYSFGLRHIALSAVLRSTDFGMFSTRAKQSTMGSWFGLRWFPKARPMLQLPTTTLVVPWRVTSGSPGSNSASKSSWV